MIESVAPAAATRMGAWVNSAAMWRIMFRNRRRKSVYRQRLRSKIRTSSWIRCVRRSDLLKLSVWRISVPAKTTRSHSIRLKHSRHRVPKSTTTSASTVSKIKTLRLAAWTKEAKGGKSWPQRLKSDLLVLNEVGFLYWILLKRQRRILAEKRP